MPLLTKKGLMRKRILRENKKGRTGEQEDRRISNPEQLGMMG